MPTLRHAKRQSRQKMTAFRETYDITEGCHPACFTGEAGFATNQ
jgi:hypothetical protein